VATELGAEPVRAAALALARRARLDVADPEVRADEAIAREPDAAESLGLTPRELEILAIVARGRTNHQIAEELFITEKTVGVHMTNILAKLGVTNRIDAAVIADRLGVGRTSAAGRSGMAPAVEPAESTAVPARHPRARRAFLFTDIVGSTALIGVIGDDAWVDLRRWHDVRLRGIFAAHHGEEIDHAGDGFLVSFERTNDAIECAVEIQRALADHRRHEGFAPSVRIGIHTSEAVREGSGFTGRAIHEGARIAAVAGPDEIVASVDALRDAPPRQPVPEPRTVVLKGITEPVAVVTIPWQRG
jgi:class 3 adenylate cyclase